MDSYFTKKTTLNSMLERQHVINTLYKPGFEMGNDADIPTINDYIYRSRQLL